MQRVADAVAELSAASFKDPAGSVFFVGDRVFRQVRTERSGSLTRLLESDFYKHNEGERIVRTRRIDPAHIATPASFDSLRQFVVEHDRIADVTYPYEWPFALLKRAAGLQLDLAVEALEADFVCVDASAYNIQFQGVRPTFIDILSFDDYSEGAVWGGYRQFCDEFLAPLLLTASLGVPFNAWYRGSLNGLDIRDLSRMLPLRSRFWPRTLVHVHLHANLIARATSQVSDEKWDKRASRARMSKSAQIAMLRSLRKWIRGLEPKDSKGSYWQDYDAVNSYDAESAGLKERIIRDFVTQRKPRSVLDLGCNAGRFSEISLSAGAERAIGVDADQGALSAAVHRAEQKNLNLLPLYFDLANPSPAQGWMGTERESFSQRIRAECVIALALLHHLIVGRNIRLEEALEFVLGFADTGIIEFVPRDDPMVRHMLLTRRDAFPDYTEEHFRKALSQRAHILFEETVTSKGRKIFAYDKNS